MEIRKTSGIILSARPLGEADVMCVILTRDFGKGRYVFKGLRKSRRRSHSAAEPGTFTSLQYYFRGPDNASIVNDFTVENYHPLIRKDLNRIYHLYLLLESLDKTTGLHDAEAVYYALLSSAIKSLAGTDYPAHLTAVFLLHLLKSHGILTLTQQCSTCGSDTFSSFYLNPSDLSVRCNRCSSRSSMLSAGIMNFLNDALTKKFNAIECERYPEGQILDLIFYLVMFIESYFHVNLKSKEFVLAGQL